MVDNDDNQVPFDRYEFQRLLDEVGQLLAELQYIDRALSYLTHHDVTPGAGPGPHPGTIDFQLGWTFPFTASMRSYSAWSSSTREAVQAGLDALYREADQWATEQIRELSERVRELTHPHTNFYTQIVEGLEELATSLSSGIRRDLGRLEYEMGEWHGSAARSFARDFHTPFRDHILDNQAWLADALAAMFAAVKAVTDLAQHSLMSAVVAVRDMLHEQLRKRSEGDREPSLREMLILAGSASGILSIVTIKAPIAAIGFGAISTGLNYAASRVPESERDEGPTRIEGQTAELLYENLSKVVKEVCDRSGSQFADLLHEISVLDGHVTELRRVELLMPQRPDLADGARPDNFYHRTSNRTS